MHRLKLAASLAVLLGTLLAGAAAHAEDYVLTLKDHKFSPQVLTIPAGQKVKITVKNLDSSPAEFESYDLNREKVVTANGQIVVFVGPVAAGSYEFFDDFHHETTTGTLKVQ